jgi:hypothetical protein
MMNLPDAGPWQSWSPGTVHFCEARLSAWVREPANAWSSLAYLAVGLWMLRRRQPGIVIAAQVFIGAGSFLFHASGTFVGEMCDQGGMYLLSAIMLACPYAYARREQTARPWLLPALVFGIVAASVAVNLIARPIGIPLFAVELAFGLRAVFRVRQTSTHQARRDLVTALCLFGTSFAIWTTDVTGLVCDPDLHVWNGHATWHVLNALAIFFLGRFLQAARTLPAQVEGPSAAAPLVAAPR